LSKNSRLKGMGVGVQTDQEARICISVKGIVLTKIHLFAFVLKPYISDETEYSRKANAGRDFYLSRIN